jgi:hypothetical protein
MQTLVMSPKTATGRCSDPARCRELARQHAAYLGQVLPGALDLHTQFLAYAQHEIAVTDEASLQMFELHVSRREVIDILECCEPIAATHGVVPAHLSRVYAGYGIVGRCAGLRAQAAEEFLRYTLVLAGETRRSGTVHVVCRFWERPPAGKPWAMTVVAVYAPSVHRWGQRFTTRTCFCDVLTSSEGGTEA